jgi:hypothetical protein
VLKNHGYHLEHNFGHGKQHLAQQFVLLNLLAFAFHTVCDSVENLWQEAHAVLGTRKDFLTDLHTITAYCLFPRLACLVFGDDPGKYALALSKSAVTDRIPTVRTAAERWCARDSCAIVNHPSPRFQQPRHNSNRGKRKMPPKRLPHNHLQLSPPSSTGQQ